MESPMYYSYAPALSPSNSTTPRVCRLSPHAEALSSVLTAFVGSIVGGISGGHFVAFYTAWICWFGTLRILATGVWEVAEAVRLRPLEGGEQFHNFYAQFPFMTSVVEDWVVFDDPFFREDAVATPPTVLGWVGWIYATCYAPTSQILWLINNWNSASGGLKVVRAIGVTVTALPLTMDTKARYGAILEKWLGRWSRCLFSLMTAGACLVLGLVSAVELVKGAIGLNLKWYHILIYSLIYSFFVLAWTHGGFSFYTPHDEGRAPSDFAERVLGGLLMGAFGGVFTASPAFTLMQTAKSSPGMSVGEYVRCVPESFWRKFTALFP